MVIHYSRRLLFPRTRIECWRFSSSPLLSGVDKTSRFVPSRQSSLGSSKTPLPNKNPKSKRCVSSSVQVQRLALSRNCSQPKEPGQLLAPVGCSPHPVPASQSPASDTPLPAWHRLPASASFPGLIPTGRGRPWDLHASQQVWAWRPNIYSHSWRPFSPQPPRPGPQTWPARTLGPPGGDR